MQNRATYVLIRRYITYILSVYLGRVSAHGDLHSQSIAQEKKP